MQTAIKPFYTDRVSRSRGAGRPSISARYLASLSEWARGEIAGGRRPTNAEARAWLAAGGVFLSLRTVRGMMTKALAADRVQAGGFWLSFDPGVRAGLALWDGPRLAAVALVTRGPQGAFLEVADAGASADLLRDAGHAFASFERLMADVVRVSWPRFAVCERGFGANVQVKVGHAYQRGVVAGLMSSVRGRSVDVACDVWRKALVPVLGPWPRVGPALKAASVAGAAMLYGCDAGPDEADAVLVGHAALTLGLVPKAVLSAGRSAVEAMVD